MQLIAPTGFSVQNSNSTGTLAPGLLPPVAPPTAGVPADANALASALQQVTAATTQLLAALQASGVPVAGGGAVTQSPLQATAGASACTCSGMPGGTPEQGPTPEQLAAFNALSDEDKAKAVAFFKKLEEMTPEERARVPEFFRKLEEAKQQGANDPAPPPPADPEQSSPPPKPKPGPGPEPRPAPPTPPGGADGGGPDAAPPAPPQGETPPTTPVTPVAPLPSTDEVRSHGSAEWDREHKNVRVTMYGRSFSFDPLRLHEPRIENGRANWEYAERTETFEIDGRQVAVTFRPTFSVAADEVTADGKVKAGASPRIGVDVVAVREA